MSFGIRHGGADRRILLLGVSFREPERVRRNEPDVGTTRRRSRHASGAVADAFFGRRGVPEAVVVRRR
jgi:hypothetical protein